MSKTVTLNVRVSGVLGEHVTTNVGEYGAYENVNEYVRDLIRRDKERADAEALTRLKAELKRAFSAPDGVYRPLDAAAAIKRNARKRKRPPSRRRGTSLGRNLRLPART